jgi:hypothetical protein
MNTFFGQSHMRQAWLLLTVVLLLCSGQTAKAQASIQVKFVATSVYVGGFNGEIRFINNGSTAQMGWTLACDISFPISSAWNATMTQVGNRYTFVDLGWNGTINPGATITVGFGSTGTFNTNSAQNCTFNGAPITPSMEFASGTGGPGVLVGNQDANGIAYQITIPQGLTDFTLSTPGNSSPSYTVSTNNGSVLAASIVNGTTLRLQGLQAGRAGLKIVDTAANQTRYVGIRVRNANGTLPGIPNYVSMGSVSEDSTPDLSFWRDYDTDLTNRRMDVRYIYLNGGPYLGWTTWNGAIVEPGGRAISFIRESLKMGMIPAFVYYNIPDGGESYSTDVSHMQSQTYMEDYFKDLKLALDLINREAPDELVQIILEPDFLGYLAQNNNDPNVMMAKANAAHSSGVLGASDPVFPDTVRGLVETINYIISTKAPYVQFGWQLNLWASPPGGYTTPISGKGVIHLTDTLGLNSGRQAIYNEASALTQYYINAGIATHGADFLSIDKYGLDAGALGSVADPANSTWFWNNDHWLNYVEFVRAMHTVSGKPVVLWQIPVGHINNSQFPNPYNNALFPTLANTNTKYEDSAPSFFLGDTFIPGAGSRYAFFSANLSNDPLLSTSGGTVTWGEHVLNAANAGVNSILFGAGVGDSTDGVGSPPTDDYWWITKIQKYYLNPVPVQGGILPTPTVQPSATSTITATATASGGNLSDLLVQSVAVNDNLNVNCGTGTLGTQVVVGNQGTGTAGSFMVTINGTAQNVAGLAAGSSTILWVTGYNVGTNTVINIDTANSVAESNESNNSYNAMVAVPTPRIACTNTPTLTPTTTNTASPVITATSAVSSCGTPWSSSASYGPTAVTVYHNGKTWSFAWLGNIISGTNYEPGNTYPGIWIDNGGCTTNTATPQSATATFTATPTATKTATPTAVISNAPDLLVQSVAVNDNLNVSCGTGTLGTKLVVRNQGTSDAGSFIVTINGTAQNVASLAAGSITTLWISSYRYGSNTVIVVDSTGAIAESNESNNIFDSMVAIPTQRIACTATPTVTKTATLTITKTATLTITKTATPTVTKTATPTVTKTATATVTKTATATVTKTATTVASCTDVQIAVEIAPLSPLVVGQPIQIDAIARHVGSCGSAGLFVFTLLNTGDPIFPSPLPTQNSPAGLAPGESKTVSFVIVPTQAGTAQLGMSLSYEAGLPQGNGSTFYVWQNSGTTQSIAAVASLATATATVEAATATPTATTEGATATPAVNTSLIFLPILLR